MQYLLVVPKQTLSQTASTRKLLGWVMRSICNTNYRQAWLYNFAFSMQLSCSHILRRKRRIGTIAQVDLPRFEAECYRAVDAPRSQLTRCILVHHFDGTCFHDTKDIGRRLNLVERSMVECIECVSLVTKMDVTD
jgi:hypothetical protein